MSTDDLTRGFLPHRDVTVTLGDDVYAELQRWAASRDQTVSECLDGLLRYCFEGWRQNYPELCPPIENDEH